MLRTTGATATLVSRSFLTRLCFKHRKQRWQPSKPPEASTLVQVGSSCSALGWLLRLGDKPPALSLPFGLLLFVVLESEPYPVSFQSSASVSPGPNGSCCSACTASTGPQAQGPTRRQSCPYDQLCLSPGSSLSVSKAEYFTSMNCEAVALGWECGGKCGLLVWIICFPMQA